MSDILITLIVLAWPVLILSVLKLEKIYIKWRDGND